MSTRNLRRQMKKIMDSSVCTICKRRMVHNSRNYYGFTMTGEVASVGECCADRLKTVQGVGLYLADDRHYGIFAPGLVKVGVGSEVGGLSIEEAIEGVSVLQKLVRQRDKIMEEVRFSATKH